MRAERTEESNDSPEIPDGNIAPNIPNLRVVRGWLGDRGKGGWEG